MPPVYNVILLNSDSFGASYGLARLAERQQTTLTNSGGLNESDRWLFFLPDGKHFLYLYPPIGPGDDYNEIQLLPLTPRSTNSY